MAAETNVRSLFDLTGRVAVITGGGGLLGLKHAKAIAEMGGLPVLVDISAQRCQDAGQEIKARYGCEVLSVVADITQPQAVADALAQTLTTFGRVDILINNAANNPKVESGDSAGGHWSHLEQFPLPVWEQDLAVGLTGAFLCSQIIGAEMVRRGRGVILNIASDLGLVAPDQRIYRQPGLEDWQQPVKPVSYSVIKHGLIGLTRYLATYWADRGIRVNALSPGGVYNDQEPGFVQKLTHLIPLGRMAQQDEYKAAVVFLVSDASSYMTGANLIIDGGRTCW